MATLQVSSNLVGFPRPNIQIDSPLIGLVLTFDKIAALGTDWGSVDKALLAAMDLDKNQSGLIQVLHFEMAISRSVSATGMTSSGTATFDALNFVTPIDSYVPVIVQGCVQGTMVKSAVFSFVGHVGEAKTQVVQVVTLTEGFITNVEVVDGLLYCRLSASSIGVDDKVKKKTTSFEF